VLPINLDNIIVIIDLFKLIQIKDMIGNKLGQLKLVGYT